MCDQQTLYLFHIDFTIEVSCHLRQAKSVNLLNIWLLVLSCSMLRQVTNTVYIYQCPSLHKFNVILVTCSLLKNISLIQYISYEVKWSCMEQLTRYFLYNFISQHDHRVKIFRQNNKERKNIAGNLLNVRHWPHVSTQHI